MITVQGVVDRVGPTLLRIVAPHDPTPQVSDVIIAEAGKRTHIATGDLVLGIAVSSTAEAVELVRHSGSHAAAAVLLKPPHASRSAVKTAAQRGGTAVVEVHSGAAWAQLVWLLRSVLDAAADESDSSGTVTDAGPFGDLFRLADAAAAVIDAPVTIEDANSRVLAYSARQDRTDPARVSTIMGRRVPDDVLARFRSRGVFRELSRGRTTIFVPAQRDGTLPRLIVPIRMGGELLGSMWAVVPGPVQDARAAAFADTAPVVALHLLRRRAREDSERRRTAELVRSALQGTGSARLVAAELDLAPDTAHRVVAIDVQTEDALGGEGVRLALVQRLTDGIGRRPAVADMHGVLYAVVPDQPGDTGWTEVRAALAASSGALVAAGSPVDVADLARSRTEADEALSLLRAGLVEGPVAVHDDVWAVLVLHRAAVAAAGVTSFGPLAALRAADEESDGWYLDTLYEWLRHSGDPRSAAAALRIHPNTLRYRMSRVTAALDADLTEPDVRLALLTQLVAIRWA